MQINLKTEVHYLKLLLLRLAIVYLMCVLTRSIFYLGNQEALSGLDLGELLAIYFYALRFDTVSIFYVNLLFVVLHVLPTQLRERRVYQHLQKAVFYLSNGTMLFFELADVVYFPYSLKRMTGNDFGMGSDIKNLLPQFLSEFWWLLLIAGLILILMEWLYRKTEKKKIATQPKLLGQLIVLVFTIGATVLAMRGGFQLRPVVPLEASLYVDELRYMPLVSNTTLSLIHTWSNKGIEPKVYFEEGKEKEYFQLYNLPISDSMPAMQKKNVMIIVIESFGQGYVGWFGQNRFSRTPFLDSLINKGLLFEDAHANGLRSTQGIAAILGGIPSLMREHYIFSSYNTNKINGLGGLLKKEGYETSFFHGGHIGTMDFNKFAPLAGFNNYHGYETYVEATGNKTNYDGNWGAWDMPFYDYTIDQLALHKEPFASVLFSINPHHPYNVPESFDCNEEKPIWCAVRYADRSLQQFFEKAKQQAWFDNTLFVITADHIGAIMNPLNYQRERCFRIPILFYAPADSSLVGVQKGIMQQIDIIPTVLDYLDYPHSTKTFGVSKFDKTIKTNYAYVEHENTYQIINDSLILFFNGKKTINMANYLKDSSFSKNLIAKKPTEFKLLENTLKAIIQTHDHAIVNNQLN